MREQCADCAQSVSWLVSCLLDMLVQMSLVREFFSTGTSEPHPEMLRVDVAFYVLFRAERLRAVRTDKPLLSVNQDRGQG